MGALEVSPRWRHGWPPGRGRGLGRPRRSRGLRGLGLRSGHRHIAPPTKFFYWGSPQHLGGALEERVLVDAQEEWGLEGARGERAL